MEAKYRFFNIVFRNFARGGSRLDITFTLDVQQAPDIVNNISLDKVWPASLLDPLGCMFFSIEIPAGISNFTNYAEYVQSQVNTRVQYIITHIQLAAHQSLKSIIIFGSIYIYNNTHDTMEKLPVPFFHIYTENGDERHQYSQFSKDLIEMLIQNLQFVDAYLTFEESAYVNRYMAIRRVRRYNTNPMTNWELD